MEEAQEQNNGSRELIRDGKTYIRVPVLADEFGYAADHVTRLARQDKVEAVYEKERWYVTRESLVAYREVAKKNKIRGGLRSAVVLSRHLQGKDPVRQGSFPGDDTTVLSHHGPSHRDESERISFDSAQVDTILRIASGYLSKVRIKTAARALLTSAVFVILILNSVFALTGVPVSKLMQGNIFDQVILFFSGRNDTGDTQNITPSPASSSGQKSSGKTDRGGSANAPQQSSAKVPLSDLSSIRNTLSELSGKVSSLAAKVDQIPAPLQLSGPVANIPPPTVTVTQLNTGNVRISDGSITTTSGNLSVDSAGGTFTVSDNLVVTGSTSFSGVTYGWPSSDGSSSQVLSTSGTGILSWTTVNTTSASGNFEVAGYASASAFYGSAFVDGDCDLETQTLGWDSSTGRFRCLSDNSGGSATFKTEESGATSLAATSILNFDGGKFTLTASGGAETIINFDWGAGGPASLSQDETVTGRWTFSGGASSSTGFEITTGNLGINAGNATNTRLEVGGTASISGTTTLRGVTYTWPSADGAGVLNSNGAGALSWAADDDIPEAGDFTNLTGGTGIGHAVTGTLTFDATELDALTWDAGTLANFAWTFNLSGTDPVLTFRSGGFDFTGFASVSTNFEAVGYASASKYFGSAFTGLAGVNGCAGADDTLNYNSTTGVFSCGTDASGGGGGGTQIEIGAGNPDSGIKVSSVSFDAGAFNVSNPSGYAFIQLDYLNGPASRSATQTISGNWTFSAASSQFNVLEFTTASASGNAVFNGTGSSSYAGSLNISKGLTANSYQGGGLSGTCNGTSQKLLYSNGQFSCGTDQTGGGGGTQIEVGASNPDSGLKVSSVSFDAGNFNVTDGGGYAIINLDWTNGPASRSATQTISGNWTFSAASSQFNVLEFTTASASGNAVFNGTGSSSYAGSLTATKGLWVGNSGLKISNTGVITAGTWQGTTINSTYGGTGVNNGGRTITLNTGNITFAPPAADATLTLANNFTTSGNFALTLTQTGTTNVTLPTSGTLAILGANTFTGLQTFSGGASSSTGFEITTGNLGINAGNATNTRLEVGGTASISGTTTLRGVTYTWPSADGAGVLNSNGAGALSWAADDDIPEAGDFTNLTGGTGITNSPTGTINFDATELGALTFSNGGQTSLAYTYNLSGTDPVLTAVSGGFSVTGFASVSTNFEAVGYVSASAFILPSTAGGTLGDCDLAGDTLNWDATTKKFICGTDSVSSNSLDFDELANTMRLDAPGETGTTIGFGNNSFTFNLDGTGDFVIQDGGTPFFTFLDTGAASTSGQFNIDVASTRAFVVGDGTGGTSDDIFVVDTTSSASNPGIDIVATNLTSAGTSAFTISVPASTSSAGRLPHGVFWITDSASNTLASMSNAGSLALRGYVSARSAYVDCSAQPHGGQCLDYAESYPTDDTTLEAGDIVAADGNDPVHVVKATEDSPVIGIVSAKPGVLLNGDEVLMGVDAKSPEGHVPVALAGRVLLKVSAENGPIEIGDFVTVSSTPGVAMKATKAGQAVGKALEPYSGEGVGSIITFVNLGFYGAGLEVWTDQISSLTDELASSSEEASGWFLSLSDQLASINDRLSVTGTASFGSLEALKITVDDIDSPELSQMSGQIGALYDMSAQLGVQLASHSAELMSLNERLSALASDSFNPDEDLSLGQGLSVTGQAIFDGGLTVNTIGSEGGFIMFNSDVGFFGRPYFNHDTGGFLVISEGATYASVSFENEYLNQPVVNVTISLNAASASEADERLLFDGDIRYVVADKSVKGFTVKLNKPAPLDIQFSWTALAIKDAKTFFSPIDVSVPMSAPTPTPSVIPEPATLPSGTSGSASGEEPVPQESPTLTPETMPEASPEVTPMPQPSGEPAADVTNPSPEPTPEITPEQTLLPTTEPATEPAPEPIIETPQE